MADENNGLGMQPSMAAAEPSGGRGIGAKISRQIILPELYRSSEQHDFSPLLAGHPWREEGFRHLRGGKAGGTHLGTVVRIDQVGPQKPVKGGGALGSNTTLSPSHASMPVDQTLELSNCLLLLRVYQVARVRCELASNAQPTPTNCKLLRPATFSAKQTPLTPRRATPTSPVAGLVGVTHHNCLPYSPFRGI